MDTAPSFNAATLISPRQMRALKRMLFLFDGSARLLVEASLSPKVQVAMPRYPENSAFLQAQNFVHTLQVSEVSDRHWGRWKTCQAYCKQEEPKIEVGMREADPALTLYAQEIVHTFAAFSIAWASTVSSRAVRDEQRKKNLGQPNKRDDHLSMAPFVPHCVRWFLNAWPQNAGGWKPEDWPQVTTFLAAALRAKNTHKVSIDLAQIPTFEALKAAVEPYMEREGLWHTRYALYHMGANQNALPEMWRFDPYASTPATQTKFTQGIQADILHADEERVIPHLQNEEAARAFGMGTSLCTAYQDRPTYFDDYSDNLVMICDANGARHQIHLRDGQYRNELDQDVSLGDLRRAHPMLDDCLARNLVDSLCAVDEKSKNARDVYTRLLYPYADQLAKSGDILKAVRGIALKKPQALSVMLSVCDDVPVLEEAIGDGFPALAGDGNEDVRGYVLNISAACAPNILARMDANGFLTDLCAQMAQKHSVYDAFHDVIGPAMPGYIAYRPGFFEEVLEKIPNADAADVLRAFHVLDKSPARRKALSLLSPETPKGFLRKAFDAYSTESPNIVTDMLRFAAEEPPSALARALREATDAYVAQDPHHKVAALWRPSVP